MENETTTIAEDISIIFGGIGSVYTSPCGENFDDYCTERALCITNDNGNVTYEFDDGSILISSMGVAWGMPEDFES